MTSKAEKLRRKRAGRPRLDGPRHECGKLVQSARKAETEKKAVIVALEGRKRVHGLTDVANDGLSGYTLGRIRLDENINDAQLRAGNEYAARMDEYYRLIGIPHPSGKAQDISRVRGFDGDESEAKAKTARVAANQVMKMEGALNSLYDGRQIKATVFNVCVLDVENLRNMPPHQMDWLNKGLDELVFFFGFKT